MTRKVTIDLPYEMEDDIVIEALETVISDAKSNSWTHPDDKKDYKRWAKAAKVLLPYFKAPGE